MTGYSLLEAARLVDDLAETIAAQLPNAAADADVEMVLESQRAGDAQALLADALVARLVRAGWVITWQDPTPAEAPAVPAPAVPQPIRHQAFQEHGTGRPVCLCGYKPGPPEATSPEQAAAMVEQHILEEQRGQR